MSPRSVREAQAIAREFVRLATVVLHENAGSDESYGFHGSIATAELRRRSMDLTRALARMRKP